MRSKTRALVALVTFLLSAFVPGPASDALAPAPAPARWLAVATSVGAFNSISCAGRDFCAAAGWSTGTDYSVTYNGKRWSAAQQMTQFEGEVESISCPVAGWCAAVTDMVAVTFYNHGHWSRLAGVDETPGPPYPGIVAAISCTSRQFCAVVDGQGNAEIFNGATWTKPHLVDVDYPLNSVSCSAPGRCVAVDGDGQAFVLDAGRWSAPSKVDRAAVTSTSCAKVFCEAADLYGDTIAYEDGRWAAPEPADNWAGTPLALSCPAPGECLAVDGQGADLVLEDGLWSRPQVIDSSLGYDVGFVSVSCPPRSGGFCAAADGYGIVMTTGSAFPSSLRRS